MKSFYPQTEIATLLGSVMLSAFLAQGAASRAAGSKPNIIIIYGDDIGYGDVGCYGATAVKTPNVDRLAAQGIRFTSGYCTSATCTPSRYSLLTGEYAFRKKGTGVLPGDAAMIIEPGRATLPAILQTAGYQTGIVGKWHLGLGSHRGDLDWNSEVKPGPLEVGFNYSFIIPATPDRVPCVYVQNHHVVNLDPADPIRVNYREPFPGEPTYKNNPELIQMKSSRGHNSAVINGIGRIGYMTGGKAAIWKDDEMEKVLAREAIQFIERSKDKPFFLYYASHDIHVPRVPGQPFVGKTTMGPRGDELAEFDWAVGQILDTLGRLKLTDNTLVILTSDNGPVLNDGYVDGAVEKLGHHQPAGPWRGGKYSIFEGGTRVPFIVSWPGRVKPGVSDAMVSQVDFCASLGALVGQQSDPKASPDSENVLPALLGDSKKGRDQIVEYAGRVALREGDWKFIPEGSRGRGAQRRNNAAGAELGHLYNLSKDPGETTDVAEKNAALAKAMAARLKAIRNEKAESKADVSLVE